VAAVPRVIRHDYQAVGPLRFSDIGRVMIDGYEQVDGQPKTRGLWMNARTNEMFPVFFVVWGLLAVGGAIFFYGGENAALKRKLHPFYIVLISVVFIAFTYYIQGRIPIFMTAMVVVIAVMNLRITRFCSSCGRMVISRNLFVAPKYCQGCGAKLDDAA
jgi:hypothetical protein